MTPLSISILLIAGALTLSPQGGAPSKQPSLQVEWLYYGGDPGNSKYSPLTDVNGGNIQQLQIAWQWKHWETPLPEYGTAPGFFENTPLMIEGVLYVTTPYNSIAAVDAETGKELWRFDGEGYKLGRIYGTASTYGSLCEITVILTDHITPFLDSLAVEEVF